MSIPLASSVLSSYLYNVAKRELVFMFNDGSIYLYEDVPPVLASELALADSVGEFFNERIRPQFAFRKLSSVVFTE